MTALLESVMVAFQHTPVLHKQVIDVVEHMQPRRIVDCTVGGAGHAAAMLEACPNAELLGLDKDVEALNASKERLATFKQRVHLQHRSFATVAEGLQQIGWSYADVLLADFGVSSHQIDVAERGFSFRHDGPLDMRMNAQAECTAAQLIGELDEAALAQMLWRYGEERHSRRVAKAILAARPSTTFELAEVVRRVVPKGRDGIDPATRTFQALRIAVNDELRDIETLLEVLPEVLADGGRALLISFHSLEDRIVKHTFARESKDCVCPPRLPACVCGHVRRLRVLTKKPITAQPSEMQANPRARSAKLRIAQRLPRSP